MANFKTKHVAIVVMLTLGVSSTYGYSIYAKRSWGYSIKCDNGAVKGIKQKSNGKWKETGYFDQNFASMDEASKYACSE